VGENAPRGASIDYYLKTSVTGDVKISIADAAGKPVRTLDGTRHAGINRVVWNLTPAPPAGQPPAAAGAGGGRGTVVPTVEPGTYIVTLTAGGKTIAKPVTVLQDRWLGER
jgi:hypothetical protein